MMLYDHIFSLPSCSLIFYLLACINNTAFLNRVSSNNLNCGLLLFNELCVLMKVANNALTINGLAITMLNAINMRFYGCCLFKMVKCRVKIINLVFEFGLLGSVVRELSGCYC